MRTGLMETWKTHPPEPPRFPRSHSPYDDQVESMYLCITGKHVLC